MNHTKEPWIAEPDSPANHSHWHIRFPMEEYRSISIDGEKMAANAERIVSCVNACANIKNPEEAIKAAREALLTLSGYVIARGYPDGPCLTKEDRDEVVKALTLLGKEQE